MLADMHLVFTCVRQQVAVQLISHDSASVQLVDRKSCWKITAIVNSPASKSVWPLVLAPFQTR